MKEMWKAIRAIVKAIQTAYDEQRDPIPDSDLDSEQPLTLNVSLTLGDVRLSRYFLDR